MGGFQGNHCEVRGRGAFAKLKFESGVHRVQRVPDTETQGRIHTSAATVAVLPEVEDVDVDIQSRMILRIETMRAQAPAASTSTRRIGDPHHPHSRPASWSMMQDAVPTQEPRFAMNILRSRIYDAERQRACRAHGLDPQIILLDVDIDILDLRQHGNRRRRGNGCACVFGVGHAL